MFYKKILYATLTISNPMSFCSNTDANILKVLENTYAGKCYSGVFVMRILSVKNRSACTIVRSNSSGKAYIDVEFLAEVAMFNRWDIIVGVSILNIKQTIFGEYNVRGCKAVVNFMAQKSAETLSVGQLAVVRTIQARHHPYQDCATVVGIMLTCDKTAPIYKIETELGDTERADLDSLVQEITKEFVIRAELSERSMLFFENLLYAYRGEPKKLQQIGQWSGPEQFKNHIAPVKDILDIIRDKSSEIGCWSRPLPIYRSSPLICAMEPTEEAILELPQVVFASFLKNILDFLVAVREMTETYNSPEILESHFNIWTTMRAEQIV